MTTLKEKIRLLSTGPDITDALAEAIDQLEHRTAWWAYKLNALDEHLTKHQGSDDAQFFAQARRLSSLPQETDPPENPYLADQLAHAQASEHAAWKRAEEWKQQWLTSENSLTAMRKRTIDLENKVAELKALVQQLEADNAATQEELGELEEKITHLEERYADAKRQLADCPICRETARNQLATMTTKAKLLEERLGLAKEAECRANEHADTLKKEKADLKLQLQELENVIGRGNDPMTDKRP